MMVRGGRACVACVVGVGIVARYGEGEKGSEYSMDVCQEARRWVARVVAECLFYFEE